MGDSRQERLWSERAAKWACGAFAAVGIWLVFRYAAAVVFVFFLAWAVASVIHPLAKRTERVCHLPRKVCAVGYFLLFLGLIGWLLFFCVGRLAEEWKEWLGWFENNREAIGQGLSEALEFAERWTSRLPLSEHIGKGAWIGESLREAMSNALHETVETAAARIAEQTALFLKGMPKLFVLFVVTVMACMYWSMDYEKIHDFLMSLLPPAVLNRAEGFRKTAKRALFSYIRAYLLIWLMTFGEVLIGLLILDQPYAWLIAVGIATVDLLPVLGSGTVLLPWAGVQLLLQRYSFGIGLLILYGVITIVRQIVEPHIVGGSLGIHPLASLFFVLLGFQLFGFWGMLLGPIAALLLKEYRQEKLTARFRKK